MNNFISLIFFSLLLLTFNASFAQVDDPQDIIDTLKKEMPSDIVSFFDRMEDCQHWADEEASDSKRRHEIDAGLKKSACGKLKKDSQALQKKYKKSPKVLTNLNKALSEMPVY